MFMKEGWKFQPSFLLRCFVFCGLFEDLQFLADLGEGGNGSVELFL